MPRRLPNDITAEILFHLPAKSVIRFRLVCREWHSLSIDPHFLLTHPARNPSPSASCLLVGTPALCRSLRGAAPCVPDPSFSFLPLGRRERRTLTVVSVCAGLVLLRDERLRWRTHYVCNPTTKQWAEIPARPASKLHLAFDPAASPHYEVVAVEHACLGSDFKFHLHSAIPKHSSVSVYSSRTGEWRRCTAVTGFPLPYLLAFPIHTFCRGSLFWMMMAGESLLVLDVVAEQLRKIWLPYTPQGNSPVLRHLGVSGGRLTIITTQTSFWNPTTFDVWELAPCGSTWSFVRAFVDDSIARFTANDNDLILIPRYRLALVLDEEGGESGGGLMLIKDHGTVLSYDLQDGSLETIYEYFAGDYELHTISHSLSPLFPPPRPRRKATSPSSTK